MSQFGNISIFGNVAAKMRFVSFEPLLDYTAPDLRYVDWIILGAQTKPYRPPEKFWVEEIVQAADKARIPVFQKDNLRPLLGDNLRQEIPIVKDKWDLLEEK